MRRPKTERQTGATSKRVADTLDAKRLSGTIDSHLIEFAGRTVSSGTTQKKADILRSFLWFIQKKEFATCDVAALRAYFAYLNTSHNEPEGRWENGRRATPMRPSTVETHYRVVGAFFNWLVAEEQIAVSPLKKVPKPKVPDDQVQPFTDEQLLALFKAAKGSRYPKRDEAILSLLFDTGVRASELTGLRVGDVDWQQNSFRVLGKGNKKRTVYADGSVMKLLAAHLQQDGTSVSDLPDEEFLFISQRGTDAGEPMNRNALYKLIMRLGKEAGIKNIRCSPHTFRHSFAISTLRAGRDVYSLQQALGHTTLRMTGRYVALNEADLKGAQVKTSPLVALKKKVR